MPNIYLSEPPELDELLHELRQQLSDFVCKENVNGSLSVAAVAKFLDVSVVWFRKAIQSGKVPFAFSGGTSDREVSYISTFAFCNWIMQNRPFVIEMNAKRVENPTNGTAVAKGQSYIAKGMPNGEWDRRERLITR